MLSCALLDLVFTVKFRKRQHLKNHNNNINNNNSNNSTITTEMSYRSSLMMTILEDMLQVTKTAGVDSSYHVQQGTWFAALQTVPYSIWDDTTPKGQKLLTDAHDRIMAFHANASVELPAGTATRYPTQAVVAYWDPAVTWVGGGWSTFKVTLIACLLLVCAAPPMLAWLVAFPLSLCDPCGYKSMCCLPACDTPM